VKFGQPGFSARPLPRPTARTDPEELKGKTVNRAIMVGEPLTSRDVVSMGSGDLSAK
jgi:Flp pilus assembly protein CpaB